jgi:hypothetical protein
MPSATISASVGEDGTNKVSDVKTVQRLLSRLSGMPSLEASGLCDDRTIQAIHQLQMDFFNGSDGLIEPNGPTFKRLLKAGDLGFVQLPQIAPDDPSAGYYHYSEARKQFGTPATIAQLQSVALSFQAVEPGLLIAMGDISFRDGSAMPPHKSHTNGRNIDLRPMRKDGKKLPVTFTDPAYSQQRTQALVDAFLATGKIASILFNDPGIIGVKPFQGHHNHLHVTTKE